MSSNSVAISVRDLGKKYAISHNSTRPTSLREAILHRLRHPFGDGQQERETFWALRDVGFEVRQGEVVGIIGRNGAGKSTLLKLLTRITGPTTGAIDIHGHIASLLEVGTGFHPELTGRENIFLNGSILGMSRRDVARKFDEIVAFAQVEKFLDTPVKRYSSGMYVRLAFAVAAHLEPEILIVDEVLAVGDAAFQKKCLGKMGEVSRAGRTVLFVSHNMAAVKSLCRRAILLEAGRITREGDVDDVVNDYLHIGTEILRIGTIPDDAPRIGTGIARFRSVRLTDTAGNDISQLFLGQRFRVVFECDVFEDISEGLFEVSISALDGTHVICSMSVDWGSGPTRLARGRHVVEAEFENILLPRQYSIGLGVHQNNDGDTFDFVQRTLDFMVLKVGEKGSDHHRWHGVRGYVRPPARWDLGGGPAPLDHPSQKIDESTVGGVAL